MRSDSGMRSTRFMRGSMRYAFYALGVVCVQTYIPLFWARAKGMSWPSGTVAATHARPQTLPRRMTASPGRAFYASYAFYA